ncbi:uncharacterized protein LOC127852330 isoform X2 [Dreissena polymorpha]|uniref:uncharacterized protein LOC127852330 isoform X2 n=1 Tax=Dreissena polymorpha TaxID=45954 RepID=UPI0022642147|nr:uncharacterized protein LOC127852330 isoform X2 [Dreissena polymorpha]
MRVWFCPRKSRHQWVAFLFIVCFVGVFLSYRRLMNSESEKHMKSDKELHSNKNFVQIQENLKQQVKDDLKSGKIPVDPIIGSKFVKEDGNIVNNPPKLENSELIVGRVLENAEDYISNGEKLARLKLLVVQLSPQDWKTAPDADEIVLLTKSEFMDLKIISKMSCREIDHLVAINRQSGYHGKKYVDYMKTHRDSDIEMVVKSVGHDEQFKISCMKQDYNNDRCSFMANYKLLKELVLLALLENPALVQLKGFCLRGDAIDLRVNKRGIVLVTEAGTQLETGMIMHLPWATKLKMLLQLYELLRYLDTSPAGSLGFEALQLHDFVLVENSLRLVDLDNLRVGEPACTTDVQCQDASLDVVSIKCQQNTCQGYNSRVNMELVRSVVVEPMLQTFPSSVRQEVQNFLSDLQRKKLSVKDCVTWLEVQLTAYNSMWREGEAQQDRAEGQMAQVTERSKVADRDQEFNNLRVTPVGKPPVSKPDDGTLKVGSNRDLRNGFQRFDNANYPAQMTVIMKNGANDQPDINNGVTLFRKAHDHYKRKPSANNTTTFRNEDTLSVRSGGVKESQEKCVARIQNLTESGRDKREKRLYAHLGMKDLSEKDWLHYAASLHITHHLGASQLSDENTKGGRFKFQFENSSMSLQRGEYLLEYGPNRHHVAHMAAYSLDRILGLYNVPPAIARPLFYPEYTKIAGHQDLIQSMLNATDRLGSIMPGIVTVSIPPVMKTIPLSIQKRDSLVQQVTSFSRGQRLELEYVLLWSLTQMLKPSHGFLGYKGHMIHFEADLAFTRHFKNQMGYFYNCQFPNNVYKMMICYKCQGGDKSLNKICGLGQEMVSRIRDSSGYQDTDIAIDNMKSVTMADIVDNMAGAILHIVDHCIKTFSRELVLY